MGLQENPPSQHGEGEGGRPQWVPSVFQNVLGYRNPREFCANIKSGHAESDGQVNMGQEFFVQIRKAIRSSLEPLKAPTSQ